LRTSRWAKTRLRRCLTVALQDEAIRRGLEGYQRPIYQRGELVCYEPVYSDQLLNLQLRARRREVPRAGGREWPVEQVVRQAVGFNPREVL
jgi:hypothetical protein